MLSTNKRLYEAVRDQSLPIEDNTKNRLDIVNVSHPIPLSSEFITLDPNNKIIQDSDLLMQSPCKINKRSLLLPSNLKLSETEREDAVSVKLSGTCSVAIADSANIPQKSTFINECQVLVSQYLLKNFDGTVAEKHSLARPIHGAMHQCRAILWALSLLEMRRSFADPDAMSFSDKWCKALVITCLLHDSGREGDGEDRDEWEKASARNCNDAIQNILKDAELAHICAMAIQYKDNPNQFPYKNNTHARLLRSLLHDADVLDIIRVRKNFDPNYLYIYNKYPEKRQSILDLANDVRDVISAQHDLRFPVAITGSEYVIKDIPLPVNYNEEFKKSFEHADNALESQFSHLARCKPHLFNSLSKASLVPEWVSSKPSDTLSLTNFVKVNFQKGLGLADYIGLYRDLTTGQKWCVKQYIDPLAAKNEKLMFELANAMGLNVPDSILHEEAGKYYLLSKWQDDFASLNDNPLSNEKKSNLLVVMSVLGNLEGIDSEYAKIVFDKTCCPFVVDWSQAGTYSNKKGMATRKRRAVFASTPYEIEVLRDPNTPMAKTFLEQYHHLEDISIKNTHVNLFIGLSDEAVEGAISRLLNQPNNKMLRLIDEYGPKKQTERNYLKQIISDRIAFLATQCPNACNNQVLTPAEWYAVQAAGVRGYWRQVNSKEVEAGQLRLYQRTNVEGKTESLVQMRLTTCAAARMADTFGVTTSVYHLQGHLDYYRNALKTIHITDEIRADLVILKRKIDQQIKQIKDADSDGQWSWRGSSKSYKIEELLEVSEHLDLYIKAQNGRRLNLEYLSNIGDINRFPSRVAPVAMATSQIDEARFRSGFATLTGEQFPLGTTDNPDACFYHELKLENGVCARFHADNLRGAKTFERTLTLSMEGDNLTTGITLLNTLTTLGLDIHRPSSEQIQGHYLDQIARYHGCDSSMADRISDSLSLEASNAEKNRFLIDKTFLKPNQNPRWQHHCRLLNGEVIFYQPPAPWVNSQSIENDYCAYHDMSHDAKDERSGNAVLLGNMLDSGSSLDSYARRSSKGIFPIGSIAINNNIFEGAAGVVFTRLRTKTYSNQSFGIIFGSETLARLDAASFLDSDYINIVIKNRNLRYDYSAPFAQKNFKRPLSQSASYRELSEGRRKDYNMLTLNGSMSLFDEVENIQVRTDVEKEAVIKALSEHIDTWPNGRPYDELVIHSFEFEKMATKGPLAGFIKALGPTQFERFIKLNPDFAEGKIKSGNGLSIKQKSISNTSVMDNQLDGIILIDCVFNDCTFKQLSFANKTIIKNCQFINCDFSFKQLSQLTIEGCTFTDCRADDTADLSVPIKSGYKDLFKLLLDGGAKVNSTNRDKSALFVAIEKGFKDIVKLLIEKGADVNHLAKYKECPLHEAVSQQNIDIVKLLIEKGADVNLHYSQTPLEKAISVKNIELIELLINKKASLKVDLFRLPIYANNLTIVKLLMDKGLDLKKCSPAFKYALNRYDINMQVIDFMLTNGPDVNLPIEEENGKTPLHLVLEGNRYIDLVRKLLEYGAKPCIADKNGKTPLHLATKFDNTIFAELLLTKIDENIRTQIDAFMLINNIDELILTKIDEFMRAKKNIIMPSDIDEFTHSNNIDKVMLIEIVNIKRTKWDFVNMPLRDGNSKLKFKSPVPDKNMPLRDGYSLLYRAVEAYNINMAKLLIENDADVNQTFEGHFSPLYKAVENNHADMVKLLIEKGANANIRSKSGETLLQIAERLKNKKCIAFFRNTTI